MAVEKRANIRVTAKTDQAAGEFEKLAKAQAKAAASLQQYVDAARKQNAGNRLAGFDKSAADVAKSDAILKSFSSTGAGLGGIFKTAAMGLGVFTAAAGAAATAISAVADRGFEVQGVFNNLAISIEPARAATHGLISDFELAKSANTLLSFGVVKTSGEFAQLSQAAQALGVKLGLSAQSTMESLSAALGRNSKLMLDNLGIILSISEAEERYARSLGKSVKALTDDEKAEAFRKEAMKAIFAAAKDVTVQTDSASAAVKRFSTELDNMRDKALGGERAHITLRQGITGLDEDGRKLISTVGIYGADLDKLKAILRDAGVSQKDMKVEVSRYGQILKSVIADEERRAEALLNTKEGQRQFTLGLAAATKSVTAYIHAAENKERLKDIERELALLGSNKKAQESINNLLAEKAQITATQLELEGKLEEAEKVRFDEELRALRFLSGDADKGASKVRGMSRAMREWRKEAAALRNEITGLSMKREGSDDRGFATAAMEARQGAMVDAIRAQRRDDLNEQIEGQRLANQTLLDIKLEGIAEQQARGLDPYSLTGADPFLAAQREAQARLEYLDRERELNRQLLEGRALVAAQEENDSQRRQVYHGLEMARIAKEQREREKFRAKMQIIGHSVANVHAGMAAAALQGATTSGLSMKAAVKHFAGAKAQEMGILAVTEGIQALASLAMFNYPAAAQHGAAAAAAGAEAIVLGATFGAMGGSLGNMTGAGGGSSASTGPGGGAGAGRGGGSGTSIPQGPPISRPPTGQGPPPPPGAPGGGAHRNVTVIANFNSVMPADPEEMRTVLRRALRTGEHEDGSFN